MSDEKLAQQDGEPNEAPNLPQPIKKKNRWLRAIWLILFFGFITIQFFQPDKNNNDIFAQNDISSVVSMPDTVRQLLKVACYDCHSNNTSYPWYSNIQPGGWWMADHVEEGKQHLNFNEFANLTGKNGQSAVDQQQHKLDEIKQTINKGEMPLTSYLWIHDEAKLTKQQKKLITDWTESAKKELAMVTKKKKQ